MSPGDLGAWLRSVFEGATGNSAEIRDPEPETGSERAVKAPLNEIDTSGAAPQGTEDDRDMDRSD